jgi:hypothetical protein
MPVMTAMYLIDTNIISELRKQGRANQGVHNFFSQMVADEARVYISVITLGELRRGVELIRHRGDRQQAHLLEQWLQQIGVDFQENILDINGDIAQLWGKLRVPHPENALDKMIAATAILYNLTLVTRNVKDFSDTGVKLLNPFSR